MPKITYVQLKDGTLVEKPGNYSPETPGPSGPTIIPDIKPYRSMIDGSIIEGRRQHREHLQANGCIEVGNEKLKPRQDTWTATAGLRDELRARLNR